MARKNLPQLYRGGNIMVRAAFRKRLHLRVYGGWFHPSLKFLSTSLSHLFPMHPFSTPCTLSLPYGFLMFSGGRESVNWEQMGQEKKRHFPNSLVLCCKKKKKMYKFSKSSQFCNGNFLILCISEK